MGGTLLECGCYDGPWSADDPTYVSVRCEKHKGDPGDGVPMRRDAAGHAVAVQVARSQPTMTVPRGRKKRGRR